MLRLRLDSLLKQKQKSLYWLGKETKIPYQTLFRYRYNETRSIKLAHLGKIIEALEVEVEPDDLIVIEDGNIRLAITEALEKLGRSFYWLSKETQIPGNTLWRLKNEKTVAITFRILEKLYQALHCSPCAVFEIKREAKTNGGKGSSRAGLCI